MERRATSSDVAKTAGVSRATVSYVLNGRTGQSISAATRNRVLAAARELGYTPSTAARTLRRGRSDLVLMLLPPEPLGRALAMIIDAASEQVERNGLRLVAHRVPSRGGAVPLVQSLAPAALILIAPLPDAEIAAVQAAGITVVSLPQTAGDPLAPDLGIGAMQVKHLVESGHERIGVAVPPESGYAWRVKVRLAAIRDACARYGLPAPAVERLGLEAAEAAAAVERWLEGEQRVSAVCAFDDDHAFAVLSGLSVHGLQAPRDLAVIGAEDIPLAGLAVPPLTTVSVDARRLGEHFAQAALASASGAGEDGAALAVAGPPAVSLILRASA
ncbi:LacI family transcriptional regulator [Arthrobacter zhangbolii]|uniref:LacI family transcriptional regulator n=1 Tax=Arthrobacter zhangbolii TaxID=2886936 RepID=A0A9X1S8I9_9MICC|nr:MULTISPECIES: LacI family DNA-binding transcriptional regulator [Arthrobacter]MCC3271978.1 LacI family transcriptional regulator [Arthrobacter zhangbolii]MCC3294540.1 LacI family transcriptional regulator [Arthrobacter zhangbolii]MDN3903037.1 LacI family DNA-binding transcriptional regulator [Arthrobacter sp. YD2]UON92138.1 LacI family transcriptional regulator [Arthrobacter zhangbolii]